MKGRKWEEYAGKRNRGGNRKNTQGRETEEETGRIHREEDKKGRKWEEYAGNRI
jgi:hypothetical protein